jgi:hypothetical protein
MLTGAMAVLKHRGLERLRPVSYFQGRTLVLSAVRSAVQVAGQSVGRTLRTRNGR